MQSDSEAEFTEFVQARQAVLGRAAYLICGDPHTAEELLQDALAKLASRWEKVRDGHPEAFVRRVLYRDSISRWRKRRREVVVDINDPQSRWSRTAGPDRADSWIEADEMVRALERVTAKQRAVLVLRYYEDLSELQTAEALGVSVGTVKSQTSAALKSMRRLLPSRETTPGRSHEGGESR